MRITSVTLWLYLFAAYMSLMAAAQTQETISLPKVSSTGGMSLMEALWKRRSVRAYSDRALSMEQIGALCWAAQGITDAAKGLRTAPSAMTLYSIQVFVVNSEGVYAYLPAEHSLRLVQKGAVLDKLRLLPPNPPMLGKAPVVLVLGMNLAPLAERVGARAERYALIETGHVAQNVLLQAVAMGLGSIPVGGFDEEKVSELLKLPEGVRPVYLLPIGYPAPR
jgi:SagB-type dehydrogenase family enzyme